MYLIFPKLAISIPMLPSTQNVLAITLAGSIWASEHGSRSTPNFKLCAYSLKPKQQRSILEGDGMGESALKQ